MNKFIVTDRNGFYDGRTKHPVDAVIDLQPGARLDAALHFKQVKKYVEKPAGEKPPGDPKDPKSGLQQQS